MSVLDPAVESVLRGALALLLGAGAIAKARDLARFRAAVEGYEILPARAAGAAAVAFASVEGLLVAALVAPVAPFARSLALVGAAAVFCVYAAAIALNLARGRREIDCGCGGFAAHIPLSGWLVARNALLVAAALGCLGPTSARVLGPLDVFAIAAAIAVLACVWSALHGLLASAAELARMQEDV